MPVQLNVSLIEKAVVALLDHNEKRNDNKTAQLLNFSKDLIAQVQLAKTIQQPVINPTKIRIPNSLFSIEEDHSICLFCKTEDKAPIDEFLKSNPVESLTAVISLTQVRKHYVQFKDRKTLLSSHSHFICDERIFTHLCNLLGQTFTKRNNLPIPIKYKSIQKLPALIHDSISSTYMHLHGSSISIRFGHTGMSKAAVVENVIEGLNQAIPKFPQAGKSIVNIHIKLSDSAALPVYSKVSDNESFEYAKQLFTAAPAPVEEEAEAVSAAPKKKKKTKSVGTKKEVSVAVEPVVEAAKKPSRLAKAKKSK